MKTILLTGATGFLGSRLAYMLKKHYRNKAKIVLLTSKEIEGYSCIVHKNFTYDVKEFEHGGIFHVDIVIHAGWFVAKHPSDRMDVEKNFSPLVNTYYLLRHLPNIPEKIIFCSSTDVYGGTGTDERYKEGEVISEKSSISLVTLYGLAKYNAELMVSDWAEQNGIDYNILRLGPLYGVGDKRKDYFVGAMLKRAAEGRNLSLYAERSMKRNLLYVDDCAQFIVKSIDAYDLPKIINLVSSYNPTMLEIVQAICSASGNVRYDLVEGTHMGKDLAYDATVRECCLGYESYSLASGMKAAFAWNRTCDA